jgi:hypothetical protein
MSTQLGRAAAAFIVVALTAGNAWALSFRVIPNDGFNSRVLLIYDCGRIKEDLECTDENDGFVESDPGTLTSYWGKGPFDEVWLLSGGGDLDAGIKIARDLYAHAQAVRVPNAARLLKAGIVPTEDPECVSSCTVAFMGGQFRTIDMTPGDVAEYEVHAASSVSWGNPKKSEKAINLIWGAVEEGEFREIIAIITGKHRNTARRLFAVFQDTLWLAIKARNQPDPERPRRDQLLDQWERESQSRSYPYPAAQEARDKQILALEGRAGLQDIIMRIERDSMDRAIAEIRSMVPRLGRRADAALAMLAAMYDTSSILETNTVPKETLTKMGYLTEFVKQP